MKILREERISTFRNFHLLSACRCYEVWTEKKNHFAKKVVFCGSNSRVEELYAQHLPTTRREFKSTSVKFIGKKSTLSFGPMKENMVPGGLEQREKKNKKIKKIENRKNRKKRKK
jgi:hypothetical protein